MRNTLSTQQVNQIVGGEARRAREAEAHKTSARVSAYRQHAEKIHTASNKETEMQKILDGSLRAEGKTGRHPDAPTKVRVLVPFRAGEPVGALEVGDEVKIPRSLAVSLADIGRCEILR